MKVHCILLSKYSLRLYLNEFYSICSSLFQYNLELTKKANEKISILNIFKLINSGIYALCVISIFKT